jgi:hypothetical protein
VHGVRRRSSSFKPARVDHLYVDPHEAQVRYWLHYCDLTDATNLICQVRQVQPDAIYNFAAQSHVKVSFEPPEYILMVLAGDFPFLCRHNFDIGSRKYALARAPSIRMGATFQLDFVETREITTFIVETFFSIPEVSRRDRRICED